MSLATGGTVRFMAARSGVQFWGGQKFSRLWTHKAWVLNPTHALLLQSPSMKGGAPLATLVHEHIRPMTADFLAPGVGLPAAIGIAKVAFLLAALHGDLMALDAAFDKAAEQ